MQILKLILIAILLINLTYTSHPSDQFDGKTVSIQSVYKSEQSYMGDSTWSSLEPISSDSVDIRFHIQPMSYPYGWFKLRNRDGNHYCGANSSGILWCSNQYIDDFYIEDSGSGTFYIKNEDNKYIYYSSDNDNRMLISSDSSIPNMKKEFYITVTSCTGNDKYQAFGSDVCVSSCGASQYKGNYFCLDCPTECATCSSNSVCTKCSHEYTFNGDFCMANGDLFTKNVAFKARRTNKYCKDDNGGEFKCKSKNRGDNQTFRLGRQQDGYITIKANSGKYCRVRDNENLECDITNFPDNALFKLKQNNDGTYAIYSKSNGKYAKVQKDRQNNRVEFDDNNIIHNDHGHFDIELF